jgi:hypothetical protein
MGYVISNGRMVKNDFSKDLYLYRYKWDAMGY